MHEHRYFWSWRDEENAISVCIRMTEIASPYVGKRKTIDKWDRKVRVYTRGFEKEKKRETMDEEGEEEREREIVERQGEQTSS